MLNLVTTFASFSSDYTVNQDVSAGALIGQLIFYIIIYAAEAIALMKIFEKAGVTAWYAWVPFLNAYWITKIACGNGWLFLLCLIPCVGSLIYLIFMAIKLSAAFGCGGGMIALLILLPIIAYFVLGFGSAQYQGPQ